MRLLLIRHGQTPSNVEGLLDTRIPGPGLTDLGLEQAAAVPAALAGETVDAIYVSDMVRTHITATPLAENRGLPLTAREGIKEVSSGSFEMRADRPAVEAYLASVTAWADGDLEYRLEGGETGIEVVARYNLVVEEAYNAGHQSVVFFSHGAVIRTWVGVMADNVDGRFVAEHHLDNTGIVVVEGSPEGGWTALTYMGDAIGGPDVDDPTHAGPAAEAIEEAPAQ
jgi:probable phosphoglycerate mutase